MIAITAELQRPPFDLAEADSELVGGLPHRVRLHPLRPVLPGRVHERDHHVGRGGDAVPGRARRAHAHVFILSWVVPILWFLGKTLVFLFLYVWLRAALPRLRYDQLMDLGWKVLIPLSLGWVLLWPPSWSAAGGASASSPALIVGFGLLRARHRWWAPSARPTPATAAGPRRRRGRPGQVGAAADRRTLGGTAVAIELILSFFGGFKVTLSRWPGPGSPGSTRWRRSPRPSAQHGRHVLNRYEDGMEKCIGCELCAGVCPADCIYVAGPTTPPPTRCRPVSATDSSTRSTTCAASTATCAWRRAPPRPSPSPSSSSSPSPTGPTPSTPRTSSLVGDDGRPKHMPWEDWREGDDLLTSAWMRATSPSGEAAYEGRVQWSGELGYGVRAPEGGQSGRRDDAATGIRRSATSSAHSRRLWSASRRPAACRKGRAPTAAGQDGAAHGDAAPAQLVRRPAASASKATATRSAGTDPDRGGPAVIALLALLPRLSATVSLVDRSPSPSARPSSW